MVSGTERTSCGSGIPSTRCTLGIAALATPSTQSLVESIHQFGPRTLHEFVRVPNRFANYGDILVYLSFFLAPFSLLVRRSATIVWVMFAFFAMYVAYWFFVVASRDS